jgi:hypothetical protein
MFCSTECRDEFYKYSDLSSGHYNCYNFLLKKIEAAFDGQKKLNKYIDDHSHSSTTIFDFDFSDPSHPNYLLNIYKCFLSAHHAVLFHDDWVGYDVTTKKLMNLISSNMTDNPVKVAHLKHEGRVFDDNKKRLRKSNNDVVLFKYNFNTFHALLNHSCVPNVEYFCIENTAIYYVKKPIKANDQLFIAYT